MSHHVYTTRGIVLALRHTREADKMAAILTRDLGLVYGVARGIRKPSSRLSMSLTDLSLVKVSLVKGKRQWRVTTVSLVEDTLSQLRGRNEEIRALSRVASLLLKLVRGEDKNLELYDELESALISLRDNIENKDISNWELYTVSRLLSHLGYLSKEDLPNDLAEVGKKKKELLTRVNAGIHESGLS